MYLLLQTSKIVLSIGWMSLFLTAIGVVTPILLAIYTINRANKKDIDKRFQLKANKTTVDKLEIKMDKMDKHCEDQRKELKRDFIARIDKLENNVNRSNKELGDKFELLLVEVIKTIREK